MKRPTKKQIVETMAMPVNKDKPGFFYLILFRRDGSWEVECSGPMSRAKADKFWDVAMFEVGKDDDRKARAKGRKR